MKTHTLSAFAIALTIVGATLLSTDAQAQNRYRRNGRVVVVKRPPAKWSIKSQIDRTERASNSLRASFERDYDRYNLNRYNAGDNAKARIQRMDQSLEQLRRVADDGHPYRGKDELQAALRNAADVERIFASHREIHSTVRGQWNRLHDELNTLARIYGVRGLGSVHY